jgi:hypothetical protein
VFKEIYNFCRASVVGVPIAKVANTLVSRLRWMASSYVGSSRSVRLNTKILKYLGITMALPT